MDAHMNDFYAKINSSLWQGIISETGLGLEFSSRFLMVPGASKTVIGVNCDYAGVSTPAGMRSVSLDNAKRMAHKNMTTAIMTAAESEPTEERFGFAITGAHYEDRDSHGWMYLATLNGDAWMHFTVQASPHRETIGNTVVARAQWFLNACMLERGSWVRHIETISDSLERNHIDVLYGPGLSDIERLLLLRPLNPLAYYNGQFRRVIDMVRDYPTIYPGAFNPPTKRHLNVGGTTLFEISQEHYYKGSMDLEDLLHRIRMLDAVDRPILITQAPRFVDKVATLRGACGIKEIEFLVGADAWNATVIHHQYPSTNWLTEQLGYTTFRIMPRTGIDITRNQISNTLDSFTERETPEFSDHNSTAVRESLRPGRHEFLTDEVGMYVERTGLYR